MAMPQAERGCLITFMAAATEIGALLTLKLLSKVHTEEPNSVIGRTQLALEFQLTRLLAGTIHEAWLVAHRLLTKSERRLERYLVGESKDAYEWLKSYSGKPGSTLASVRNRLCFHLDTGVMVDGLSELPETEPIDICDINHIGGRRYPGAALVQANAVGSAVNGSDADDALDKFLQDVSEVTIRMVLMLNGWIDVVVDQYLSSRGTPQVVDVPDARSACISAICDLPDDQRWDEARP